ncbi:hypothetical protein [Pseudomonas sp.]|uniref:hypothetical protein n=1 Tax=Pseudomonas sp. TaxID=306 RepID=UPI0028B19792|nr:hypothetical protein [Pseudomonas sp.]
MRLAYLSVPVLGLLLVGCGPDEDREREATPAKPVTEQPAAPSSGNPSTGTSAPEAGNAAGTMGTGTGAGVETTGGTAGDVETAPGDNGSGLGTASGAGTAPNTTGTGSGAAQ